MGTISRARESGHWQGAAMNITAFLAECLDRIHNAFVMLVCYALSLLLTNNRDD